MILLLLLCFFIREKRKNKDVDLRCGLRLGVQGKFGERFRCSGSEVVGVVVVWGLSLGFWSDGKIWFDVFFQWIFNSLIGVS